MTAVKLANGDLWLRSPISYEEGLARNLLAMGTVRHIVSPNNYLIEARNLNEAIQVAARIPGAWIGCVKVRPIAEDEQTLKALGLFDSAASR